MPTATRHRSVSRAVAAVLACAVAGGGSLGCQALLPRPGAAPAPASAAAAAPVAAPPPAPFPARPLRVLVLGDSLSGEARAAATETGALDGRAVDWSGSIFGSAPCNGLATVRATTARPDVVLVAYSGNADGVIDNCMAAERGPELIARYERDVAALVDRFRDGRTRVAIVAAPYRPAMDADPDQLLTALEGVARAEGVAFVDGGRAITPGRVPRASQPCLPTEATCGTAGPGRNLVRNPDGIHLCPSAVEMSGRCGTYSSGAVRYAAAFADAVEAARVPAPTGRDR